MLIPDITIETDMLDAALRYAAAGMYVIPVRAGTKNPGSVIGAGWPTLSTRDPQTIAAWWAGTSHGIALHAGRSGLLIIDIDQPDQLDPWLAELLDAHPTVIQHTRPNQDLRRGHWLYQAPPGPPISNSTSSIPGSGFDIRGANGVILATPTRHPDGGEYRWHHATHGSAPVAATPHALTTRLRHATPSTPNASPEAVTEALTAWTGNRRPQAFQAVTAAFQKALDGGGSRHEALADHLVWTMEEARAGHYPAKAAADTLRRTWLQAFNGTNNGRRGHPNHGEYEELLAWAIGRANTHTETALTSRRTPSPAANNVGETLLDGTPQLRWIRDHARHARVSPLLTLGASIAAVLAETPPTIRTPAFTGTPGSLNYYVAAVGVSGQGKNAAVNVAIDDMFARRLDTEQLVPSSGEGIAALYCQNQRGTISPAERSDGLGPRTSVLANIDEIGELAARGQRRGSTLNSTLRSVWSGGALSQHRGDRSLSRHVDAHTYRYVMIVGVQPDQAAPLLDDGGAGTWQRFAWLPADDPNVTDTRPPPPGNNPFTSWHVPQFPTTSDGTHIITYPPSVAALVDTSRVASLRGDTSEGGGHDMGCRLRTAAGLAILHGLGEVDDLMWELSGLLHQVSDATRQRVIDRQRAIAEQADEQRGRSAARQEAAAAEHNNQRLQAVLERHLRRHGAQTRGQLRQRLQSRDRGGADAVLEEMKHTGIVVDEAGVLRLASDGRT